MRPSRLVVMPAGAHGHPPGSGGVRAVEPPVGFQYLVIVSDLRRYGWAGDRHAASSYSWISPPRIFRRRIRAVARLVTGTVTLSPLSGGRRFLARCGRRRL